MINRMLRFAAVFVVLSTCSMLVAPQVEGWAAKPLSLHEAMTRDALSGLVGLEWDEDTIGNISSYADEVDWVEKHCSLFAHRVKKYQTIFHLAGGETCYKPGAEFAAAYHIHRARKYYDEQNIEWQREFGYAIHYIQDAVCPPHVFPFREGFLWAPHTDFEIRTYFQYVFGESNWPSRVRNACPTPVTGLGDLYREVRAAADQVWHNLPCWYVKPNGQESPYPDFGGRPTLAGEGWEMAIEDIGYCMELAAALVKGAAFWVAGVEPSVDGEVLVLPGIGRRGG